MEGTIGEIRLFGPNWAPRNWALCEGQILPINQYQALFSILGTTYGGDGRTSFALPDLRGRAAIHEGQDFGEPYALGQKGGQERVVLTLNELPAHNHDPLANTEEGDEADPTDRFYAQHGNNVYAGNGDVSMGATTNTGGGQSHENMQPWLATSYIICIQGAFPSRN